MCIGLALSHVVGGCVCRRMYYIVCVTAPTLSLARVRPSSCRLLSTGCSVSSCLCLIVHEAPLSSRSFGDSSIGVIMLFFRLVAHFQGLGMQDLCLLVMFHALGCHKRWCHTPPSWVKLSTYESCIHSSRPSFQGGLIRDPLGAWFFGFVAKDGYEDPFLGEV